MWCGGGVEGMGRLDSLSEKEIDELAKIMDVGFLQDDLDRDDKILVLSSEAEEKINDGLKKLGGGSK
ncbi:hypothetical protein HN935_02425 [archaeon]|nr:hypothetical protein [archaeon]